MQNTEILMELHDKACEARQLHGSPTFNLESSRARAALETEIEILSIQYHEARQFSNQIAQERIRLLSRVEELEQEVHALKNELLSIRANATAEELQSQARGVEQIS